MSGGWGLREGVDLVCNVMLVVRESVFELDKLYCIYVFYGCLKGILVLKHQLII